MFSIYFIIPELHVIKPLVEAALFQKLLMGALFHHGTLIQYIYGAGVFDGEVRKEMPVIL